MLLAKEQGERRACAHPQTGANLLSAAAQKGTNAHMPMLVGVRASIGATGICLNHVSRPWIGSWSRSSGRPTRISPSWRILRAARPDASRHS